MTAAFCQRRTTIWSGKHTHRNVLENEKTESSEQKGLINIWLEHFQTDPKRFCVCPSHVPRAKVGSAKWYQNGSWNWTRRTRKRKRIRRHTNWDKKIHKLICWQTMKLHSTKRVNCVFSNILNISTSLCLCPFCVPKTMTSA